MKRLLVLSVLLGLLALPVFADHATMDFGGDDTFGFITDFGDGLGRDLDLTWDVMVGIDDYNSFTWSLKDIDAQGNIVLDKALTTTDIGMWLGAPVGFMVMWGYDDPDANEFGDVSGYGNQAYDFSPSEYWGLDFLISISMLEIEVALNPKGDEGGSLLAGLAVKEPVPGLNAEVYYFQGGGAADVFDEGSIGVGAAYATEVAGVSLEAGVSFEYMLDSAAAVAWDYGVGIAAGISVVDATIGIEGMDGSTLDSLTVSLDAALNDMFGAYAGLATSFASGADTFQGADLGVVAYVGAVETYIGYLITSNDAGDYNAPTTLPDGGLYIKFDVDY